MSDEVRTFLPENVIIGSYIGENNNVVFSTKNTIHLFDPSTNESSALENESNTEFTSAPLQLSDSILIASGQNVVDSKGTVVQKCTKNIISIYKDNVDSYTVLSKGNKKIPNSKNTLLSASLCSSDNNTVLSTDEKGKVCVSVNGQVKNCFEQDKNKVISSDVNKDGHATVLWDHFILECFTLDNNIRTQLHQTCLDVTKSVMISRGSHYTIIYGSLNNKHILYLLDNQLKFVVSEITLQKDATPLQLHQINEHVVIVYKDLIQTHILPHHDKPLLSILRCKQTKNVIAEMPIQHNYTFDFKEHTVKPVEINVNQDKYEKPKLDEFEKKVKTLTEEQVQGWTTACVEHDWWQVLCVILESRKNKISDLLFEYCITSKNHRVVTAMLRGVYDLTEEQIVTIVRVLLYKLTLPKHGSVLSDALPAVLNYGYMSDVTLTQNVGKLSIKEVVALLKYIHLYNHLINPNNMLMWVKAIVDARFKELLTHGDVVKCLVEIKRSVALRVDLLSDLSLLSGQCLVFTDHLRLPSHNKQNSQYEITVFK